MKRCQCNKPSVDHAPYGCRKFAYYEVDRDGRRLFLCTSCDESSDRKLARWEAGTWVTLNGVFESIPETHQFGSLSIENLEFIQRSMKGQTTTDFGLQVSSDGRVWVCINGIAFLRFKPV